MNQAVLRHVKHLNSTLWDQYVMVSNPTPIVIREKAFREMKKDVGMTTAQKSKETRRMEMGSIFVLYIQPTIPTYTLPEATRRICRDCWLDIQNKD